MLFVKQGALTRKGMQELFEVFLGRYTAYKKVKIMICICKISVLNALRCSCVTLKKRRVAVF